jgi:hypothetical protein
MPRILRRITFTLTLALLVFAPTIINANLAPSKNDRIPLTSGSKYDRNPSVVADGSNDLWLFFARTQIDCDRLQPCPADNTNYDLYYMRSTNNGKTWGAPALLASNPNDPEVFYGRTVAATRRVDGTIFVFWASGGDGGDLYYYKKAPGASGFTFAGQLEDTSYFNVEAVSAGNSVYVYYEDAYGTGIYGRTFDGTTFGAPTPVRSGSIPKVIIDRKGVFRMALVDTSTPSINVVVASSTDGINWGPSSTVITGGGAVTNWDPTLVQTPDGVFHLYWAPDQGDGRQRIEQTESTDFLTWAPQSTVTEGIDGDTNYWDYWPEAIAHGDKVSLFYTSERGIGGDPGTGHIWTTRLK